MADAVERRSLLDSIASLSSTVNRSRRVVSIKLWLALGTRTSACSTSSAEGSDRFHSGIVWA